MQFQTMRNDHLLYFVLYILNFHAVLSSDLLHLLLLLKQWPHSYYNSDLVQAPVRRHGVVLHYCLRLIGRLRHTLWIAT